MAKKCHFLGTKMITTMLEINYNEKKIVKKKSQKKVKMPKMALFCALHFSTEQNIYFSHIVEQESRCDTATPALN